MNKPEKGKKFKCKKSFHAPGLPGGFTYGCFYEVLKTIKNDIFILDDENNPNDPMDLSLEDFFEYFEV